MKILCTHNDLDGISNKILSIYFGLDFDSYVILDYNFERTSPVLLDKIKEYDEIFFTDFCPSKEFLIELLNSRKKVSIFDHHDSSVWSKDIVHDNFVLFHDTTICGTKIFFEKYIKVSLKRIPVIVSQFVDLVDTYDTWKKTSPLWAEAQNLNRICYKLLDWEADSQNSYNKFVSSMVSKLDNLKEWKWSSYEQRLIDNDIQKENRIYDESEKILQTRTDEKDRKFGLFKAGSKISVICSRLLEKYTDLDYIICINTFKENEFKLSCRSLEFDTTKLKIFEGHKLASGASMGSKQEIDDFWFGKINSIPYKKRKIIN